MDKRERLKELLNEDVIFGFVQSAIENQIDGNEGWWSGDTYDKDAATAKNCGLTKDQLIEIKEVI